jgi:curved DNA-binding protein CbpA
MQPDYYNILGISCDATARQIKQAYRIKAKIFHPDVNKKDNAKSSFQVISEAYHILINPEKRRWYDFKLKYPSTTGMNPYINKRDKAYESYHMAYTRRQQARREDKESEKYVKTLLDNILFYLLVVTGALALIFGLIQLIFGRWKGIDTLSGLFLGIWFLFLLFYGWNLMNKK